MICLYMPILPEIFISKWCDCVQSCRFSDHDTLLRHFKINIQILNIYNKGCSSGHVGENSTDIVNGSRGWIRQLVTVDLLLLVSLIFTSKVFKMQQCANTYRYVCTSKTWKSFPTVNETKTFTVTQIP